MHSYRTAPFECCQPSRDSIVRLASGVRWVTNSVWGVVSLPDRDWRGNRRARQLLHHQSDELRYCHYASLSSAQQNKKKNKLRGFILCQNAVEQEQERARKGNFKIPIIDNKERKKEKKRTDSGGVLTLFLSDLLAVAGAAAA